MLLAKINEHQNTSRKALYRNPLDKKKRPTHRQTTQLRAYVNIEGLPGVFMVRIFTTRKEKFIRKEKLYFSALLNYILL